MFVVVLNQGWVYHSFAIGLSIGSFLLASRNESNFSFGMKFRPLGKDQTPKIDLTFSPNCGIIRAGSRWMTDICSVTAW